MFKMIVLRTYYGVDHVEFSPVHMCYHLQHLMTLERTSSVNNLSSRSWVFELLLFGKGGINCESEMKKKKNPHQNILKLLKLLKINLLSSTNALSGADGLMI